jgi:hypothetical protein
VSKRLVEAVTSDLMLTLHLLFKVQNKREVGKEREVKKGT